MEIASIGTTLLPLAFLACPIGMGAMMWFMARGNSRSKQHPAEDDGSDLASLRAEQVRLAAEVDRFEHERSREPEGARGA